MGYTNIGDRTIIKTLQQDIESELMRAGIFSRVFGRAKDENSVIRKLNEKGATYKSEGKMMQDYFGLRVGVYFLDDIASARQCVNFLFEERSKDSSIDALKTDVFGPVRYNIVYNLSADLSRNFAHKEKGKLIDTTFEVQFRSMLSEGWHEVEHDLRYKCKQEWTDYVDQSRSLNGIFATLENCDHSMIKIFEELAYMGYRTRNYSALVRNKFRLRLLDGKLSHEIHKFIDSNPMFSKSLVELDRTAFLNLLIRSKLMIPLTYDNVVILANRLILKFDALRDLESSALAEMFDSAGYEY